MLQNNVKHYCPSDPDEELIRACECYICAGGCDELNPYCGDCYLCEARADDDYWWEVNRADVLRI